MMNEQKNAAYDKGLESMTAEKRNRFKGRKHSDETKAIISTKMRGVPHNA